MEKIKADYTTSCFHHLTSTYCTICFLSIPKDDGSLPLLNTSPSCLPSSFAKPRPFFLQIFLLSATSSVFHFSDTFTSAQKHNMSLFVTADNHILHCYISPTPASSLCGPSQPPGSCDSECHLFYLLTLLFLT